MASIPADHLDLLERPLFGHLATTRPDGSPQVNPMWFSYDGEHLRFTHTDERRKYRNLLANPAVALSVQDPDNPYRYLEVRGRLVEVVPDPTGSFYVELAKRYGRDRGSPPRDAEHRVILVVEITHATWQ